MLPFLEKKNTDLFVYEFRDFNFPAHFHDSMEIIFVEQGEIILALDNKKYLVAEGQLAVIFPGRIHFYERAADKPNRGFVALFGQRLIGEYKKEAGGLIPENPVLSSGGLHPDAVHALMVLRKSMGSGLRLQRAYTAVLLCRIWEKLKLKSVPQTGSDILYRLVDYMEGHFRENISLDDAAGALYINRFRLSGIFSKVLGMSFNDYLNSLRVNLAMQLIETTDSSMTAIAFDVGFLNVRTFNRAFMKNVGITPSEYRKTRQKTAKKF